MFWRTKIGKIELQLYHLIKLHYIMTGLVWNALLDYHKKISVKGPSYIFKFLAEKILVYNVIKPWAKNQKSFQQLIPISSL